MTLEELLMVSFLVSESWIVAFRPEFPEMVGLGKSMWL